MNIKNIVNKTYREVVSKGIFDIKKGNEPIGPIYNSELSIVPHEMKKYVDENSYGCCFVFSAYILDSLYKNNINAYMIGTVEGNGTRCSVLYQDGDEFYIANPVEDVEYFTDNNIDEKDRDNYYLDNTCNMLINGNLHNDSRYTIDEFSQKYGNIWIIAKMDKNVKKSLKDAMSEVKDNVIYPPEKATLDYKKLIKK